MKVVSLFVIFQSLTSISSSSLFVSSLSLFGYGVFMPGGAESVVFIKKRMVSMYKEGELT